MFYGDIGVRFAKRGDAIVVVGVNPFYPERLLRVGDVIKRVNSKKITSISDGERYHTIF